MTKADQELLDKLNAAVKAEGEAQGEVYRAPRQSAYCCSKPRSFTPRSKTSRPSSRRFMAFTARAPMR